MARPHAMLRAGFPYLKCLGSRNVTFFPIDIAIGKEGRVYVACRSERAEAMAQPAHIVRLTFDDDELGRIGGGGTEDGKFQWPVMVILALGLSFGVDLLCYTPDEYSRKHEELGIVRTASLEGVRLFECSPH